MLKLKSIKTQLILCLICFAIFLALKDRDALLLVMMAVALISALAAESIILYFKTKIFQITESAIITGLIVGYVLSSDEAWFKFVLASVLGIFLTIIFFGVNTQWKGAYLWYIVLSAGFYFAYKLRKLALFGTQAIWQKVSL